MRRRAFDFLVSLGAVVLATAMLVAALVFRSNASFAKDNVRRQLDAQNISFPPQSALSAEERRQAGVVRYAGRKVRDGDMARVYADEFIALHLRENLGGKTYSELSTASRAAPGDAELAAKVQTAFRGETLRGLLLTTYAFWTLGAKADQAAAVFAAAAAALLVLSLLGFWHYARTPKREQLGL